MITQLTPIKKRLLLIVCAVVVVIILFSLSTKSTIENKNAQKTGLVYGDKTLTDLVNTDSDLDGVFDWEEGLWGTDPLNKDTNGDGVFDKEEIDSLKGVNGLSSLNLSEEEENLTETDKFSREVFTTVATLTQTGGLDQETVESLGSMLAEQIRNPIVSKTFLFSDIKTINNNTPQGARAYINSLEKVLMRNSSIYKNGYEGLVFTLNTNYSDILQKYLLNPDNDKVLGGLDQSIKDINNIISGMKDLYVPVGLSVLHLDILNSFQKLSENMTNTKLANKDPVVAMGAASKYEENALNLEEALNKLKVAITQIEGN